MSDRYFVRYEDDRGFGIHYWCVFDRQRSTEDYWDSVCMSLEEADAQKVCDSLNLTEKSSQEVVDGPWDLCRYASRTQVNYRGR